MKKNLIACKDCGEFLSTKASACPHCGAPTQKKGSGCAVVLILMVAGIMWISWQAHVREQKEIEQTKIKAATEQVERVEKAQKRAKKLAQRKQGRAERKKRKAEEYEICKQTLQCWGDEHLLKATYASEKIIEKTAKYQFKWTDGWMGTKMSRFRWKNKDKLTLTYFGDSIQFQNGFGAWQNMTYQCDYDPINDKVLDVRVYPGRL